MKNPFFFAALLMSSLLTSSCEEGNDPGPKIVTEGPGTITSATIFNLPADPATSYSNTGTPLGTTGKFKFFSFSSGQSVPNSDSLTNKWDIGFRGTTIIINGGTTRIGSGGAIIISDVFDNLAEAPAEGYATDGDGIFAIPTGSGNGWYTYNAQAGTIIPTAGKILIIKTGEGKFAKLEILSYYKDAPASPTQQSPGRYYTFRYSFQPDGSRNFK